MMLAALTREPLRLALAGAMLWCAWYLALQLSRRVASADRATQRGWFVCAACSVGAGLWIGALSQLRLVLDPPPGTVPYFATSLLALLAAALAGAAALLATRAAGWLPSLAAGLGFGVMQVGVYGAWMHAIGDADVTALGLGRLAMPALVLLLLGTGQALLLALGSRSEVSGGRVAAVALVLAGVGLLPVVGLLLALPELAVGGPPGGQFGWVLAALAAMLMGLAFGVVQFERRLLEHHEQLSTRLQQAHANLERTPFLDALTGLPNRVGMDGLLRAAADRAEVQSKRVALLFIGLDGFKAVNESYGHGFGDAVLREIALRLGAAARDTLGLPKSVLHTLARVGGDEFALMLQGEIDRRALSRAAGQLLSVLTAPLTLEEREVTLSASLGLACFPDDSGVSKLISHADAAMQAAKHAGGSTYMFFEARMHDDARERMELLRDLRRAVEDKQLELFYQPKIDAKSGQITAAEALLRWHHPTRGMVSPGVFIPIAERYGLISTLGNWVIEDACRQARVWRERGLKMRVAINLSAFQMRQDDLVERIQAALKRHGIDPSRLTCEITESVAM
jgi:diguanylate cyclase (GGDEF)-like protein